MAVNKPIQFKRSDVVGKAPTAEQLLVGELAINFSDRKIYTKNKSGAIIALTETINAPISLVGTAPNALSVTGPSFAGTTAEQIANTTSVNTVSLTKDARVGTNYPSLVSRVVQDIIKLRGDSNSSVDASDSTRAISVYGTVTDSTYKNSAYITTAGSIYAAKELTVGPMGSALPTASISVYSDKNNARQTTSLYVQNDNGEQTRKTVHINEAFAPSSWVATGNGPVSSWKQPWTTWSPVSGLPENIVDIVVGYRNAFAITGDGDVWAAGEPRDGNLGLGNNNGAGWTKTTLTNIVKVWPSYVMTWALDTSGQLWFAGNPTYREYMTGLASTPSNMNWNKGGAISDVKEVWSDMRNTVVLKNNGEVWVAVGDADKVGLTTSQNKMWAKHPGIDDVKQVAVGEGGDYYFVKNNGELYVCGYNYYGNLGVGHTNNIYKRLQKVNIANVKQVNAGYVTGRLVTESGELYTCGAGGYGTQAINNSTVSTWTKVSTVSPAEFVTGYSHLIVKLQNGQVWGATNGQPGIGISPANNVLTNMNLTNVKRITSGDRQTAYEKSEGDARISHASTAYTAGSTIKVSLPGDGDISGKLADWNAVLMHQSGDSSPKLRIAGTGKIETADTITIRGKEVYHPGNPPAIDSSSVRNLTNNLFDVTGGSNPVLIVRSMETKDADNLSFIVEDSLSKITYNNDDAGGAIIITLNNTDSKNGSKTPNKHELIFSGGVGAPTLTVNGKKVFFEGNLPSTDQLKAEPLGAVTEHAGKLAAHPITGVNGLPEALASKVPNTIKINGKPLTSDITLTTTDLGIVGSINPADYYTRDNTYNRSEVANEIKSAMTKIDTDGDGVVNKAIAATAADTITGMNAAAFPTYYGKDVNGAVGFHAFAPQVQGARLNQQITIPNAKPNVPVKIQLNTAAPMLNLIVQCYKSLVGPQNVVETLSTYNGANILEYYYEEDNLSFNANDATVKTSFPLRGTEVRANSGVYLSPTVIPADYSTIKSF